MVWLLVVVPWHPLRSLVFHHHLPGALLRHTGMESRGLLWGGGAHPRGIGPPLVLQGYGGICGCGQAIGRQPRDPGPQGSVKPGGGVVGAYSKLAWTSLGSGKF